MTIKHNGKSYEELNIGDEASFTKIISEEDERMFIEITEDSNPIHVDEEYAKKTIFKTKIVHGWFTESLISTTLGTKLPGHGTIVVGLTCRYKAPTFIGDTITAKVIVKEKIEEKQWIMLEAVWKNQNNKVVIEGEVTVIPPLFIA